MALPFIGRGRLEYANGNPHWRVEPQYINAPDNLSVTEDFNLHGDSLPPYRGGCNVGKSRSYELIAIADGRKTLEEVRDANRERQDAFVDRYNGQSGRKHKQKQHPDPPKPDPIDDAHATA